MRLAMTTAFREARANVERTEQTIAGHQRELSSGRRISALSDDPLGAANAIAQRSAVARLDSYARATDSLEAKLTVADSVLSDIITQVTSALSSVAGAKTTTKTQTQQEAIAVELEGVRDTIFSDVNTQLRGSFLFSGAATTTQPYTKNAGVVSSYQGDQTAVYVDVDPNTALQLSMNGDALLRGSDANDIFVEFDQLIVAVRADDQAAIDAGMAALDRQLDRAAVVQTRVGTDLRRLGNQRSSLEAQRREGLGRLSRFEDANLVDAITGLQGAEHAHQAGLRAIATRLQLSVFDFLR